MLHRAGSTLRLLRCGVPFLCHCSDRAELQSRQCGRAQGWEWDRGAWSDRKSKSGRAMEGKYILDYRGDQVQKDRKQEKKDVWQCEGDALTGRGRDKNTERVRQRWKPEKTWVHLSDGTLAPPGLTAWALPRFSPSWTERNQTKLRTREWVSSFFTRLTGRFMTSSGYLSLQAAAGWHNTLIVLDQINTDQIILKTPDNMSD